MSELSPPGGSERYGACDDEGAAPCGRPVSPSVICFANATSLVRGRLFSLAPSDEGRFPLSGGNVEHSETKEVGITGPYGQRKHVG